MFSPNLACIAGLMMRRCLRLLPQLPGTVADADDAAAAAAAAADDDDAAVVAVIEEAGVIPVWVKVGGAGC